MDENSREVKRAENTLDDGLAESIKDRGHEVERPGDVEVRDIDVPVFVSHEWLLKSGSFLDRSLFR